MDMDSGCVADFLSCRRRDSSRLLVIPGTAICWSREEIVCRSSQKWYIFSVAPFPTTHSKNHSFALLISILSSLIASPDQQLLQVSSLPLPLGFLGLATSTFHCIICIWPPCMWALSNPILGILLAQLQPFLCAWALIPPYLLRSQLTTFFQFWRQVGYSSLMGLWSLWVSWRVCLLRPWTPPQQISLAVSTLCGCCGEHCWSCCRNSQPRASNRLFMYLHVLINGWQLAKMKKSIPDMSLP